MKLPIKISIVTAETKDYMGRKDKPSFHNSIIDFLLIFLVPLITIIITVPQNDISFEDKVIKACGLIASTAGASACTLKGMKKDEIKKMSAAQPFAICFAMVVVIQDACYNPTNMTIGIMVLFTVLAFAIMIYMFVVYHNELEEVQILAEKKEQEAIKRKADEVAKKSVNNSEINLARKEDK